MTKKEVKCYRNGSGHRIEDEHLGFVFIKQEVELTFYPEGRESE